MAIPPTTCLYQLLKPASSHENISQMINFMARQEQQIKTKFLYFIKTYRFCGFSYKEKKENETVV